LTILFSELLGGLKMNKKFTCILLALILFVPVVFAAEIDAINKPLNKIYNHNF
jgi:hypothetical protein